MATGTLERTMAESERRSMPIRLGTEALEAAKIAAAYKGMTLSDYATRVLHEAALRDIEEGHKAFRAAGLQPPTPPKRKPKGE
jgi:hypothetical protein